MVTPAENSAGIYLVAISWAVSATSTCRSTLARRIRNLTDIPRAPGLKIDILAEPAKSSDSETEKHPLSSPEGSPEIRCPICGALAVQEKCKVICRSET